MRSQYLQSDTFSGDEAISYNLTRRSSSKPTRGPHPALANCLGRFVTSRRFAIFGQMQDEEGFFRRTARGRLVPPASSRTWTMHAGARFTFSFVRLSIVPAASRDDRVLATVVTAIGKLNKLRHRETIDLRKPFVLFCSGSVRLYLYCFGFIETALVLCKATSDIGAQMSLPVHGRHLGKRRMMYHRSDVAQDGIQLRQSRLKLRQWLFQYIEEPRCTGMASH